MAPKLYEHETRIAEKAAVGLGVCYKPIVGPWQGPGGVLWGKVPQTFLAFWHPKDIKKRLKITFKKYY